MLHTTQLTLLFSLSSHVFIHSQQCEFGTDISACTPACAGQNIQQIDNLFVGDILGKKSDIADGSLRDWEFRKFNNLVGDYYIAPAFLDNMAVSCPQQFVAPIAEIKYRLALLVSSTSIV